MQPLNSDTRSTFQYLSGILNIYHLNNAKKNDCGNFQFEKQYVHHKRIEWVISARFFLFSLFLYSSEIFFNFILIKIKIWATLLLIIISISSPITSIQIWMNKVSKKKLTESNENKNTSHNWNSFEISLFFKFNNLMKSDYLHNKESEVESQPVLTHSHPLQNGFQTNYCALLAVPFSALRRQWVNTIALLQNQWLLNHNDVVYCSVSLLLRLTKRNVHRLYVSNQCA